MNAIRVVFLWAGLVACGVLAAGFGLVWLAWALVDIVGSFVILPVSIPSAVSALVPLMLVALFLAGAQGCWKQLKEIRSDRVDKYDLIPAHQSVGGNQKEWAAFVVVVVALIVVALVIVPTKNWRNGWEMVNK